MVFSNNFLQTKRLSGVWGSWAQIVLCQIHLWSSCYGFFMGCGSKSGDEEGYHSRDIYVNGK